MNKKKLIELRCKAWGITEDEYYCNQCADFSLEDMARAYRRVKNKGRAELEKKNADLQKSYDNIYFSMRTLREENAELRKESEVVSCNMFCRDNHFRLQDQLTKAKELLAKWVELYKPKSNTALPTPIQVDTEQFLRDLKK